MYCTHRNRVWEQLIDETLHRLWLWNHGRDVARTQRRNRHQQFQVLIIMHSVMQSDGISLIGDVVLDSFTMSYRDEYSI